MVGRVALRGIMRAQMVKRNMRTVVDIVAHAVQKATCSISVLIEINNSTILFTTEIIRCVEKLHDFMLPKECVAVLIGLYKKNVAVSCVGIDFISIRPLCLARTRLVEVRFI